MVIISRDGIEEEVEGGGEMVELAHSGYEDIRPEPYSPPCDLFVLFDGVPEIDSDVKISNYLKFRTSELVEVRDGMWNSLFAVFLQVNMTTKIRQMSGNLEIRKEALCSNLMLENKEEAEKTETQLVRVFDYAWNTGGNGVRRPNDTLLKLDKMNSSTSPFPNVTRELQQWLLVLEQPFIGKKSEVQIKSVSPVKLNANDDQTSEVSHSRVFKFGRTQPRLVGCVPESVICGVNLEDGAFCIEVPVQGRKRCEVHKGMRISSTANNVHGRGSTGSNSNTISDKKSENEENCTIICGILLRDGSACTARPIKGRKRCRVHKGRRVTRSISLQDDSTWDEHFGRRLSLVLDESQTTAVLGSTSIAMCNHKSSIKLIWGSHWTGNTKTLRFLLCTKSCRPVACAQTDVAVKEVVLGIRKLDFYHMDPGQDDLLRSLGDLQLSGSSKPDQSKSVSQVLMNPSDWENYLLCKEGIESCRNHNLPLTCSFSGFYELGVASTWTNLDSEVCKLDPNRMITVYPGQADHNSLENKEEAKKTETQLVSIFDYAWNSGGNGAHRPNDILPKLDKINSSTSMFPNVTRELQQFVFGRLRQIQQWVLALEQSFIGKKSSVQIKLVSETKSDASNDQTNDNSHSRVCKFGSTQPRLCDMNKEDVVICGVSFGDGCVCKAKPVRGRKRCQEHKWKRIIGCVPELVNEDKSVVCGVNLKDGSCCVEVPVQGRKRCALHKGMRISSAAKNVHAKGNSTSDRKSQSEEICTIICGILLNDGSVCDVIPIKGRKRCGEHKGQRVKVQIASVICGVGLGDGSVCSKHPVKGRKRCEMHKGRRVTPKLGCTDADSETRTRHAADADTIKFSKS